MVSWWKIINKYVGINLTAGTLAQSGHYMKSCVLFFILLVSSLNAISGVPGGFSREGFPTMNTKNGYVEPFQIFDNVYYVGDKWVSAYIIKTSEGLILVDTLESPFSKWIPENLKKLSLDASDIKYVLVTHGHSDHVAGAHYLQKTYGAEVVMTAADYELAESQAAKSKREGHFLPPVKNRVVTDNSILKLGNTVLKLYITPGHTQGCLSIDFFAINGNKKHRAFIVGGMGGDSMDLEMANQYLTSLSRIRQLNQVLPAIDINLSNHPRMNQLFERQKKLNSNRESHPFVDASGFLTLLDKLESRGKRRLAEITSSKK
jgi:metallo-beta-lactamase class B